MNMKQFQYVLVLSQEKSFSKAAEELNISQPSLSQYIRNIEKEIGADLFERSSGNVKLTDAGQIYLDAGKKILTLERQMKEKLDDLTEFKTGTITIGTSPYYSASMMPYIAKEFKKIYPGICLIVKEMTTSELLDASNQGQFDLCLSLCPIDERVFDYELISEEEILLAVPSKLGKLESVKMEGHHYPVINIRQMNNLSFVTITEGQAMQRRLDNLVMDYQLNICSAITVKSLEAQIEMVKEGIGVALVPKGIERFCSNEVSFYSFKEELPKRKVAVFWEKGRELNRAIKDLLNIVKEIEW